MLCEIILIYKEPVEILRLSAVFPHVIPREKLAAAVVENSVEHNADPKLVRFFDKSLELRLVAEIGVDHVVVKGVVFMVGVGIENRRKIYPADPQLFQIRQPFADSAQVAAVNIFEGRV